MEKIKDSKGKVIFKGGAKLVTDILIRYKFEQEILTEEGQKFDKDVLLEDCIEQQIDFERHQFENSFKVYF